MIPSPYRVILVHHQLKTSRFCLSQLSVSIRTRVNSVFTLMPFYHYDLNSKAVTIFLVQGYSIHRFSGFHMADYGSHYAGSMRGASSSVRSR